MIVDGGGEGRQLAIVAPARNNLVEKCMSSIDVE